MRAGWMTKSAMLFNLLTFVIFERAIIINFHMDGTFVHAFTLFLPAIWFQRPSARRRQCVRKKGKKLRKTILKLHRAIRPNKFRSNKSVTQAPNHIIVFRATARINIRKNTRNVYVYTGKGITIRPHTLLSNHSLDFVFGILFCVLLFATVSLGCLKVEML